jgi:hypothetical protein
VAKSVLRLCMSSSWMPVASLTVCQQTAGLRSYYHAILREPTTELTSIRPWTVSGVWTLQASVLLTLESSRSRSNCQGRDFRYISYVFKDFYFWLVCIPEHQYKSVLYVHLGSWYYSTTSNILKFIFKLWHSFVHHQTVTGRSKETLGYTVHYFIPPSKYLCRVITYSLPHVGTFSYHATLRNTCWHSTICSSISSNSMLWPCMSRCSLISY